VRAMTSLHALPLILRWAAIGAVSAAVIGGIVGLIVGLLVRPATAWFAVFELGIPASILGGLVGLACGAIAYVVQRTVRRARRTGATSTS
jgi:flagellar biosynthesis protein FliR